jgi:hypothetical protein
MEDAVVAVAVVVGLIVAAGVRILTKVRHVPYFGNNISIQF